MLKINEQIELIAKEEVRYASCKDSAHQTTIWNRLVVLREELKTNPGLKEELARLENLQTEISDQIKIIKQFLHEPDSNS